MKALSSVISLFSTELVMQSIAVSGFFCRQKGHCLGTCYEVNEEFTCKTIILLSYVSKLRERVHLSSQSWTNEEKPDRGILTHRSSSECQTVCPTHKNCLPHLTLALHWVLGQNNMQCVKCWPHGVKRIPASEAVNLNWWPIVLLPWLNREIYS